MLRDLVVIDNVFSDPDRIVEVAKKQQYYNNDDHPYPTKMHYSGMRSTRLQEIDSNLESYMLKQIMDKIVEKETDTEQWYCYYNYMATTFFHYLTKKHKDEAKHNWFHQDPSVYAAVVYLNKNPPEKNGTILQNGDKFHVVDNEYNRLVLYKSNIVHSAEGGFGNDVNDARLTYTMFFDAILINVMKKELQRFFL